MRMTSVARCWLVLPAWLLCASGCETGDDSASGTGDAVVADMDDDQVRTRIQGVLQDLDSAETAKKVPMDEFLIKGFKLVNGRDPDALEFQILRSLVATSELDRSDVLTMILADSRGDITPQVARGLLADGVFEKLTDTRDVRELAASLRRTSIQKAAAIHKRNQEARLEGRRARPPAPATAVPGEGYGTYFGYLHSHTSYSDGEGTPDEAYRHARDQGEMDFFAVTDHSELLSTWFWNNEWKKIRETADAYYQPGVYVTLWGFEYSNPLLGHALVLNTSDFTSAFTSILLGNLYSWIEQRPDGFGTFNHPGNYDTLGLEFYHLALDNPNVVPQMVGIELWNGADGFDRFYYENEWSGADVSYFDTGNRNGWYLGALGAQDNHVPDWGTKNQFRTAVLASGLSREALIEAYRARRFYATEDKDLHLDFRCAGYPMGSRITGVTRQFEVTARDAGGDSFSELRIYRNGELIDVSAVTGSDVATTFTDTDTSPGAYYYVIAKQTDDNDGNGRTDEAITSPIWID
jgi:hypothetical protein